MNNVINDIKADIISIGCLLWEKDLVCGWNGNISARVDDSRILLTGRGTCLGYLKEDEYGGASKVEGVPGLLFLGEPLGAGYYRVGDGGLDMRDGVCYNGGGNGGYNGCNGA